jgi:low affinity Fe/Cu permease
VSILHDRHGLRLELYKSPRGGLTAAPEQASVFQRVADWTSAAMGRPTNIMIWLVAVIAWTLTFALGGPHIASGDWLPAWFTSQGFNFPLNLITTVAELFIGFLVGAASNRSERNLETTLGRIEQLERAADEQAKTILALLRSNTDLLTQVHQLQTGALTLLGGLEHVNAELNVIREAVAPGVPNPAAGTDTDRAAREHERET